MDVTNGAQSSLAATLADDGGPYGIVLPIVGLALVCLIIGAFWLGKRRTDEEPPPPSPEEQPVKPDRRTHIEETGTHGGDAFPTDGRRLSPHQLSDRGGEVAPPEADPPRDPR
ncbi:DUF6479 family protein [Streptomyces fulvorobeus]|uniref:Secreted protein n=1 Tax=Streptomyces fulvorobeus TaxID=284028 RepID=A0A7J0BYX7_9ACTN|nr:DUF6479 family protein [Streptomyces fulvorobeus]NYE39241.1 hypothetical protein [Streptomyces fulvorobeus]GFM95449.1 hypothetical protein Sfulv_02600 [Streptomyces fulvorobeus]